MEHQNKVAEAIEQRCDTQHDAKHNCSVFLFKDAQLSPFVFLRTPELALKPPLFWSRESKIQTHDARVACLQLHRWVTYP